MEEAAAEARALGDEIIKKAVEQANRIINDASQRAQQEYSTILEKARQEAEQLRQQAQLEGMEKGAQSQIGEIRQCIASLEQAVSKLEGSQAGFMAEYEANLKWMALEISSKILSRRIEDDDLEMLDLVKDAVNSVGSAKWITVEVSNQMPELFDELVQSLNTADSQRLDVRQISAPPGTCVVDTPSGIVDASVYTQIENLREYFLNE